ncbi:RICIN domain-containing protein [Streptomyces sp. R28]|uniref:RICIN domain-containing protein n=1 Tax=Streptomyces sp. R28 TaxID=3238628 RepID=A0AB39PRF1_9ACTN
MSRFLSPPTGTTESGSARGRRLRRTTTLAALFASVAALALPGTTAQAADTTVAVDFATAGGAPTYRASGTIYGMTENGSLPQEHFYKDIKWKFMRAGGAQLDGQATGGWLAGKYDRRWNSTLAQYKRTKALGGTFIILPHDLYGADGSIMSTYPGDNGDWSDFDAFYDRLIADVKAAGMTDVQWDIWNEPDWRPFFDRPQAQYLEMWKRSYQRVRAAFPNMVISGPSSAGGPSKIGSWWDTYLDYVKANNVAPDIYSWHDLPGDPVADVDVVKQKLAARSLTTSRPFQVNEYAQRAEQNPGRGAWYISRLERAGVDGLRANWGDTNLHDLQAGLLTKNSAGQYLPRGEWFLYRYYGSQTGNTVKLTPGSGTDGLATKDNPAKNAKILLGSNGNTGNVTVNLNRLDTTSVVENGQVRAIVQRISDNGGGAVTGPVTVSDQTLTVGSNSASLTLPWTNSTDSYTVTLLPPSNTTVSTVAVAQHSGQCLDDTNLSTVNGTQYQQYHCEGGYQQMLDFKPVAGRANTYTIVNEHSGKCLDVSGASTADGAAVIQYTCNGTTNQMFTLNPVTALGNSKDYQLVAVHSGKCVDVSEISTTAGAKIHQWTCDPASALNNKKNQIWRLQGKG